MLLNQFPSLECMVYEPQEDSFLLKEFVKRYAKGVVLDMGTGSGLQAREAAHSKRTTKVFAVDIDRKAIAYAKKHANHKHHKKIKWFVGDLFRPVKKHLFDTIIFNPPYLPQDHKVRDIALEGGKRGDEVIERFLDEVNDYLKPDGIVLLVFSSLTPNVHQIMEKNLLVGRELGKTHMFFEDIFVYLLKRSPVLKQLHKKGVRAVKYFAKGKRGYIFTGKFRKKKVAIKVKNPKSAAQGTISKEVKALKIVNKHGIWFMSLSRVNI
jgi:release factor glutamine methyltransferase